MMALFHPLLSKWYQISSDASDVAIALEMNSTPPTNDYLRNITHEYFGKFLANGLSHLTNLPDSWDKIF